MVCIVYIFVLFQATKMCCISLKFVQFLFQYCYFSFAVIDSPYSIFLFYLSTFLITGGEAFHSSPLFVPFALALCLAYCLSFSLHPSNSPRISCSSCIFFSLSTFSICLRSVQLSSIVTLIYGFPIEFFISPLKLQTSQLPNPLSSRSDWTQKLSEWKTHTPYIRR